MAISIWNKYDYVKKMRDRIATPTTWTDVMDVKYSDSYSVINGYASTEPALATGTRGTAYAYSQFTLTAETLTINQVQQMAIFIDEADRYQQTYVNQMNIADYHGKKTVEKIESLVLAQHSNWKDFGATDLSNTGDDDTSAITVSASNIDDIIRAVKRKLYANNGVDLAVENGIFFVWRAADFEFLEAFVQANGFTEADISLKNGIPVQKAFRYMGVDHYLSNSHTAGHVFCGIKKMGEIGILTGTYGKVKFIEDPPISVTTNAPASGLGIVSRVDYGFVIKSPLVEKLKEKSDELLETLTLMARAISSQALYELKEKVQRLVGSVSALCNTTLASDTFYKVMI